MNKYAIIGAGISGMSTAHFLLDKGNEVIIYERDAKPGGLIKCRRINGSLFHMCGGHVFNSKRQDVLDWFWSHFARDEEFKKADRKSCVFLDKNSSSLEYECIPYPIENHVYLLDMELQNAFYNDLEEIDSVKGSNAELTDYSNFGDFLRWRFGKTLYNLYFKPYNEKVWRCDLNTIPMSWMEGKLPMPTTSEMRDNNAYKVEEKAFVHSTFWYEKNEGSQYIADKLAENLNVKYDTDISNIQYEDGQWIICGEAYDRVVFCGNIKDMISIINGVDVEAFKEPVKKLEYHGTTTVFCEIDKNPYSWIYQPSRQHKSHRIICTGNFSGTNNDSKVKKNRITATIEFTDEICKEDILDNLKRIPLNPTYIDHVFSKYTYPIQDANTRGMINELKGFLANYNFYFTGRFADWEYYNMDVAIGAAMDLVKCL
ncbi:protoporphyrinogen/coproporphyrinogen oxidase [Butyrivibrio sp. FCS006]|uniref:protoporphyrinogen/coproporphyrinogen oxidase n=1 Tax=Butyrivibrio sp. FCS006 TaxID=1280684 RepID=UPI00041A9DEC|nr:NAD(P)-binding protein [Butyrivibrio sp. FCS006]